MTCWLASLNERRVRDEAQLELLVRDAALLDSNNFVANVGAGEREARVACPLVRRRHFGLAHGVGRSGDITAEQPKAAGSTLLTRLSNLLAADALRVAGAPSSAGKGLQSDLLLARVSCRAG